MVVSYIILGATTFYNLIKEIDMTCKKNGNCEQGRDCDCDRSADRSCAVLFVLGTLIGFALWCIINEVFSLGGGV